MTPYEEMKADPKRIKKLVEEGLNILRNYEEAELYVCEIEALQKHADKYYTAEYEHDIGEYIDALIFYSINIAYEYGLAVGYNLNNTKE